MNQVPVCIYHKDCSDGTAAASVFLHAFPQGKAFPLAHGHTESDIAPILECVFQGETVYTIDCVLGVRECLSKGAIVISLDHHIGVVEEMKEFAEKESEYTYVFRNDLSGATLAWEYFFPKQDVPYFLQLIQDKDLWTNKIEDAMYFSNWTYMHANKPEDFKVFFEDRHILTQAIEKGKSIDELNTFYTATFQEKAKPMYIKYKEYFIPMYNSTYQQSILGNNLVDLELGVCIIFSVKESEVRMSIRSIDNSKISALELAKHFGGGGHRNAAGCRLPVCEWVMLVA